MHRSISRPSRLAITLGIAALAAGPGMAAAPAVPPASSSLQAQVVGLDGAGLGTVTVQQTPTGVLVTTDLRGLPEGEHGFHFHEKGLCDPAQKFTTAGGHFTAGDPVHGLMAMGGPHGGDMPNQHVGPDGVLKTQVLNTGVTITPGPKSIVDADGTALVIHANPDDYVSQPAGNAGGRIACAVLSAPK